MKNSTLYWIAAGIGLIAGFVAAGSPSSSGIYSTFVGTQASSIYNAGNTTAGGTGNS
jgi:hypothetical protein